MFVCCVESESAEISEIVGLFILFGLKRYIKKEHYGIYRDDFLAVVRLGGPQVERLRKNLFKYFETKKLKVTIEANIKETDFLDISFNLESGLHKPFRKDDNVPSYINKHSNHPTHIKNNLPTMISKQVSILSSNEEVFNQEAYIYNEGLKQAGYNDKIRYMPTTPDDVNRQANKRRRKRNVIYFCPPWNDALKTNLGQKFLALIDKHFKKNTFLGKLFNRNTVNLSYSTTKNVKSIITGHNNKLLNPVETRNDNLCNCVGFQCPLNGECQKSDLVYSCKVESANEIREYIGFTRNTFKIRWNAHNTDSRYISKRNNTTLANYVWSLKENNINYSQTWRIEMLSKSYCPELGQCGTCTNEKLLIMKTHKARQLMNKRTEILTKCRHRAQHLLSAVT